MTDRRISQYSLVSSLNEELDRNHVQDAYELKNRPPRHVPTTYPKKGFVVSEEEVLLHQAEYDPGRALSDIWDSPTLGRPFQAKLAKAQDFLSSHNLVTAARREKFVKGVLRSGPAQRADTESESDLSPKPVSNRFLQGWRMGVFLSLFAVSTCLVVELIMLGLAMMLNKKEGDRDGIGVLYVGDCAKVELITTIVGIPLNIIATVLVATSNYVMQCLSAPSRKEIDKAHASGSYLNIGISSVHNLIHNMSVKSLLWAMLVLSTIPIHLFLNSAFFGSLQANNYGVMVAFEGWEFVLADPNSMWEFDIGWNGTNSTLTLDNMFITYMLRQSMNSTNSTNSLQRLTADECFARYSKQLQSTASNVILVIGTQSSNYSHFGNDSSQIVSYSLAPHFRDLDDYNQAVGFIDYVDPWKAFQMRSGVGLSMNPSSGNAVPLFDATYHWTSAISPANVSGGIYYILDEYYDFQFEIPSVFTSFDYNYWTVIKEYDYNFNNTKITTAGQWNPNSWMCPTKDMLAGERCTGGANTAPEPWLVTPEEYEIEYCLSQNTKEQCQLQYSFHILLIVIGCDVAKIVAMAAALWMITDHPLATLGDAVASFLESPDPYTRGCCLMQQSDARRACGWNLWSRVSGFITRRHVYDQANQRLSHKLGQNVVIWKNEIARWYSAPSKSRWIGFAILYVSLFSSSLAVLVIGIRDLRKMGITTPLSQGFGSINPNAIFEYPANFDESGTNGTYQVVQTNKPSNLLADVVTVNTPQLLFSTLYFMYNGMFTCMVTAAEWSQLGSKRKTLRVSEPRLGQRSTYWLQLPWRYSLPLLCMSSLLHWLVSRSLFIVRIAVYGWNGEEQSDRDISACGYSPLAIMVVIIVVFVSLVVMAVMSFRKLTPGIPLCGTNSLAVAAACHYSVDDEHKVDLRVECRPLLWGVTKPAREGSPGHCCITSDPDVGQPVEGMEYR